VTVLEAGSTGPVRVSLVPDVPSPNVFPCTYDDEWSAWLRQWELARAPRRSKDNPVTDFCADCVLSFQTEMVAQGRCVRQSNLSAAASPPLGEQGAAPCPHPDPDLGDDVAPDNAPAPASKEYAVV
jgi:hypothetical protein